MNNNFIFVLVLLLVLGGGYYMYSEGLIGKVPAAPEGKMDAKTAASFFVTSENPGTGANLGGLVGADAYCTNLAEKAGLTGKTWRAYLSTTGEGGVNARDRIGSGPWYNVAGMMIAKDVAELHGENNLNKETALNEMGETVSGRGDEVNMHDILTGSTADGTADTAATGDTTCANWTSSGEGSAIVGHHDRVGINDTASMKSWNSSHPSRGCSLDNLKSTGGGGLYYCFAE